MKIIEIKTLIDITNTRVLRENQGTVLEWNQQRNFTTLLQCLELRSIIDYDFGPTVEKIDVKNLGFGTAYKGQHRVWTFTFSPDRSESYEDEDGNEIGGLVFDLNEIPVIKNLTETINIDRGIFDLSDAAFKNTIVKARLGIF